VFAVGVRLGSGVSGIGLGKRAYLCVGLRLYLCVGLR
jgi:hypothetical protein